MAHNFRLTGDYYVSKDGDDLNDGLTPDTPKKSLAAGLALVTSIDEILIVGAGVYNGTVNENMPHGSKIYADGYVIVTGTGLETFRIQHSTNAIISFYNFHFRNLDKIEAAGANAGNTLRFYSCLIECDIQINNSSSPTFYDSVIINSTLDTTIQPNYNSFFSYYSIFINCTIDWMFAFDSSYIDSNTTMSFKDFNINLANFKNSIIEGTLRVNGDVHGLTNLATFLTNYPTADNNNIDSDPLFNNVSKQDFSVQSSSPMIGHASNGYNVGSVTVGSPYYAGTASEIDTPVTKTNLTGTTDLVVGGGGDTGLLRTDVMTVNSGSLNKLSTMKYIGELRFDKDETGGTTENQNVPDYTTATTGAGANPDRLTYKMRWSTGTVAPTVDADWDNNGVIAAGNFAEFEWNTVPMIDAVGQGNGSTTYNGSTASEVVASYIQLEIILRNDYE
jgi:hypothetical protein